MTVYTGDDKDNGLYGLSGNDTIHGEGGNDTISGGLGDDKLFGDTGDDIVVVSAGHDLALGGAGIDTLNFFLAAQGVKVSLSATTVHYIVNNQGSGVTTYSGFENLQGSNYDDVLTGDNNANNIRGGSGNDTLIGKGGDDVLYSGLGNEVMTGGSGKDKFGFFNAPDAKTNFDHVTDFTHGDDTLFFAHSAFTDLTGTGKTHQFEGQSYQSLSPDEFQAGNGHTASNAQIRMIYDSHNGILYYDDNGSASGGLEAIAQFDKGLHMTASDLYVFPLL